MIEYKQGNLLEENIEALVNIVNCVGVMGEAQEPLKLHYKKHYFAPYADNLNHVLPEGKEAAQSCLEQHPEAKERLKRVSNLINGFETPYGVEMLATIHWVATREDTQAVEDCERAIELVQQWNERKCELFKPSHLRKAWERLKQQNWFFEISVNNN